MMRMDEDTYRYILERIKPIIKKRNTKRRNAIHPDVRLTVFLRFLAYGKLFLKGGKMLEKMIHPIEGNL